MLSFNLSDSITVICGPTLYSVGHVDEQGVDGFV